MFCIIKGSLAFESVYDCPPTISDEEWNVGGLIGDTRFAVLISSAAHGEAYGEAHGIAKVERLKMIVTYPA